jgi:hypothetical protein
MQMMVNDGSLGVKQPNAKTNSCCLVVKHSWPFLICFESFCFFETFCFTDQPEMTAVLPVKVCPSTLFDF